MTDEYIMLNGLSFKIIEVYNPINQQIDIILYTEFMPAISSNDYFTVEGVDVTDFLSKQKIFSRDAQSNFQTTFIAFMQKSVAVRLRYSNHFAYKVIS